MAGVTVAAEWQLLYNRYYRKPELYQMEWKQVDLTRNKIACAPFAGPIAAIRDDAKIVHLYAESALRKLRIFTSSGRLTAESVWRNPGGRLIGMFWTDDLTLACITQDGTVYSYSVHAELLSTFSLGKECFNFDNSVVDCVFWGNGVVCITEALEILAVPDFKAPRAVKLADCGLEELPHCMAVIEPGYAKSGGVEVLLGVGDHVLLVEEDGIQPLAAGIGPLQKMVLSRKGEFVASFTHDGRLLVMSSDFSKEFIDYTCESALPPEQLAWCGSDAVLLYWEDMLLMVGPYEEPVRYIYDEPIILIPECDGVRILSNTTMEFLHRVPDSTVSIFQIGSTSPPALLYDALEHFDRRSAKAAENLKLIHSSLPEAVESCIDAAGYEFDISLQRTLLRAASYGQTFSSHVRRDSVREICQMLRVLNAVRDVDIGIPLSLQQYKLLTPSVLINRLIKAHKHLLALRLSEYLGLSQEVVIMHWACTKISASAMIPDATLLQILLDKLKICKGISYAAVAAHADKRGRRKLAAMLVEHELCSSKQIPLLLSIGEEYSALVKATESGDTDLVYLVMFHIWKKSSPMEFFSTIQARPLARDLFIKYARCYKHEFLKDFFLSTGQLQEVAYLLWKESWELAKDPRAKGSSFGARIKLIEKASNLFAESNEHMFESNAAEEHAKLLRIQRELEITTKQAIFLDSSVSDTIRTCIVLGNHRAANKVRAEFKVADKRWYWLKCFALATIQDWDALEKFSKEKRPPIGYRPFVEACIDAGKKDEALKYIPKLSDLGERAEAFAKIGMAREAADAASQSRDSELLARFRQSFSQNAGGSSIFDALRDRLLFQALS
ncbi:protein VACUOLELESS1-like [Salvia splendens]|uniref:protein VACUOLELESS1-like n=1 Tax=Salvia splendens TaxID=180675 RepID=UPI001C2741EE|nr:protein VACUOLELESS1-like [Salvia splendens]